MSQPVAAATGRVDLVGGISSFGPKPVQSLTVAGQNLTQQLVSIVGTPNVTRRRARSRGRCPA
jgi:hypothetical protein